MMDVKSDPDYRIVQQEDDTWMVFDNLGLALAGPFSDPLEAAKWARGELIRKAVRKQAEARK
jgi:hypothetical protein